MIRRKERRKREREREREREKERERERESWRLMVVNLTFLRYEADKLSE